MGCFLATRNNWGSMNINFFRRRKGREMDFSKDHLFYKLKQGFKKFNKLRILAAKIKHVCWYMVWEIT